MASKSPQVNVRASTEQLARWRESASTAASFNAWAVAALDAAAGGDSAADETPAASPPPDELVATSSGHGIGVVGEATLGELPEPYVYGDHVTETERRRLMAVVCRRRRQHRRGQTCPDCGTTP